MSDGGLGPAYQPSEVEAELDKSPDAFRTISEVADDLDIPQHVLRFWETRFAQIKPLKRGGGRRYYRPDDVDLLRGIRRCLYDAGYTIKGLQRILKEQGPRHVQAIGRGGVMSDMAQAAAPTPAPAPARMVAPSAYMLDPLPVLASVPAPVIPMPLRDVAAPVSGHATVAPTQARAPASSGPTGQGLAALKATLFELDACRRMLESALSAGENGLVEEL